MVRCMSGRYAVERKEWETCWWETWRDEGFKREGKWRKRQKKRKRKKENKKRRKKGGNRDWSFGVGARGKKASCRRGKEGGEHAEEGTKGENEKARMEFGESGAMAFAHLLGDAKLESGERGFGTHSEQGRKMEGVQWEQEIARDGPGIPLTNTIKTR